MISHILVGTDFSTPSKTMLRNLDVFRDFGVEKLTLLYVRRDRAPIEDSTGHERYYQELLEEEAKELESEGWDVDIRNELGRAGSRIVEVADEVGAEMITVANYGRSAVEDVVLGSVATDVLERSTLPVFLFCAGAVDEVEAGHEASLWQRVVHPTDFSKAAEAARQWATRIANWQSLPVALIHAVDNKSSDDEFEERRHRIATVRDELDDAGVSKVDVEVVRGEAKKVLDEMAQHYPAGLFVMGSHGRSWFRDLVFGGVARSVARRGTHHALFVPAPRS